MPVNMCPVFSGKREFPVFISLSLFTSSFALIILLFYLERAALYTLFLRKERERGYLQSKWAAPLESANASLSYAIETFTDFVCPERLPNIREGALATSAQQSARQRRFRGQIWRRSFASERWFIYRSCSQTFMPRTSSHSRCFIMKPLVK